MSEFIRLCAGFLAAVLKSRAGLQAENLALRHQLCVYQRSVKRPKVKPADRITWSLLARAWTGWKDALIFVKPDTVIRWQRKRFKEHWRKLSQSGEPGRPPVPDEVKELIRTMSSMNPTWGSPRIVGELAKLGISVDRSTVDKYKVRVPKPPSPTWRAFLKNHMKELVSVDFLVVPTVRFRILYVFLILSLERRRIIHFAVTEHPTAAWAAQQVVEAFPWDTSPKYLLRDRDKVYGDWFRRRVKNMGIEEVLTAPYSPWQNPYSERLNGSIRRECLDHIIVFGEDNQLKYHPRTIFTIHLEGEDVLRSRPGSAARSWGFFIIAVVVYHVFSRLRAGLTLRKDIVWNGSLSLSCLRPCNGFGPGTILNLDFWKRRFAFRVPGSTRAVLYQRRRRKWNCFGKVGSAMKA